MPPRQAAALTFRPPHSLVEEGGQPGQGEQIACPRSKFLKKTRRTVNAAVYFSKACCYVCDMNKAPPSSTVLQRLRTVGLRPTRQRLALARLLFESGHRHITAEHLHGEAMDAGIKVSLATVYNTLHQFTEARPAARGDGRAWPLLLRHQYRRPPSFLLRDDRRTTRYSGTPSVGQRVADAAFRNRDPPRRHHRPRSLRKCRLAALCSDRDTPRQRDRGGNRASPLLRPPAEASVCENTSAEGKAPSVQFLKFRFATEEIARFKTPGTAVVVGFDHPNYAHTAVMPEPVRAALAQDFD